MNDDHRVRPASPRFVERIKIDLPTVIVDKRIWNELHVRQIGQKLKQRITWLGNQNIIARIAKQPEYVRISLTRTGSHHQPVRIKIQDPMRLAIILANGL